MSEIGNRSVPKGEGANVYRYQFGPFGFESQLEIPELQGLTGVGGLTVRILVGTAPREIADSKPFGQWCWVSLREYLLHIPGVARYYVHDGNEVVVELADGAPAPDISTYLLGSVFGTLCHQNGLLPLHASAVEMGGAVTAFLGQSGAGKSTLAACLKERGYGVISDDICVLMGDPVRVIPVAGWLKLWRPSFDHLGAAPEEKHRVLKANDKYRMYLEADTSKRPKLDNLLFLAKAADSGTVARLEAMPTGEAIAWMLRLTYLGYITELTGSHARVFRQCAQVLQGARAWRLTVPWGFDRMDEVLELVEGTLGVGTAEEPGRA